MGGAEPLMVELNQSTRHAIMTNIAKRTSGEQTGQPLVLLDLPISRSLPMLALPDATSGR